MLSRVQSTSIVKLGLSMLSSTFFLMLAMNFQSKSVEQLMHSVLWVSSFSSRLPYLWRNKARLASRLAMVARRIPMLNGFTTYSSAPVCSPSMMFLSVLRAVSRITGMCEVSMSFFTFWHSSSPRISGIMMSEIIRSGKYSFTIQSADFPLEHTCTW